MSTDRKIAWFGIGLAFIGLFPIFRDANIQLRVAYSVVFLSLAASFIYATIKTSGPQVTTKSVKKTLTIADRAGHLSHVEQERKIYVNYGSIQEVWCRGIYADGVAQNFAVDGDSVPQHDQSWSSSIVDLRKRFSEPIFSDHQTEVTWCYDLLDSFPAKHEAFDHEVTQATKAIELTVHLPADRVCIRASLHVLVGGDPIRQMEDPEISPDRRTLRSQIKSPKSGHTLRLSWDW